MALRDQPYIPVYVDRFTNDEKLRECSAAANGVMIRLMAYIHKANTEIYGKLPLKISFAYDFAIANGLAKDVASAKVLLTTLLPACLDFASMFASMFDKQFPYTLEETRSGLMELCDNGVIYYEDFCLCQRGMIKQGQISDVRSKAGVEGGKKREKNLKQKQEFAKPFAKPFALAKTEANSIIVNVNKNRVDNEGVSNNTGGVEGSEKVGGEEEEVEIDHYGKNYHLETTIEHCKHLYFNDKTFDMTRDLALGVLYRWNPIDDRVVLSEVLELWANEFNNSLISRAIFKKKMSGDSCWPDHFRNWLMTQKDRLKSKPNGRVNEYDNKKSIKSDLDEQIKNEKDPEKKMELQMLRYKKQTKPNS